MEIYQPREDSFMLAKHVGQHAFGKVLDMGTGSGIQAEEALKSKRVKSVLAVDINPEAVKLAKQKGINAKVSDLFSNIKGKFDTIIFNPPYLPDGRGPKDFALDGGKNGYETIRRFFDNISCRLNPGGIIILLFSSLTKKEKVEEIIENACFEYQELEKQTLFFEKLYVYLVKRSALLETLEKTGFKEIKKLAKGHRGIIYTGNKSGKKYAIKTQLKGVEVETISNEIRFLKVLNKQNIGPKLYFHEKGYFIYEFVPGVFIPEYMGKNSKDSIKKVLKSVFMQCYKMDQLGIDKEEMHHPYKHIIVGKKAVLVDFERAHYTEKPKNVTQFCQYVSSTPIKKIMGPKGIKIDEIKMRELSREYKNNPTESNFKDILKNV